MDYPQKKLLHHAPVPTAQCAVTPLRPPVPGPPRASRCFQPVPKLAALGGMEGKGIQRYSHQHSGQIAGQKDSAMIRSGQHHPDEVAPDVDFSKKHAVGFVFVGRRSGRRGQGGHTESGRYSDAGDRRFYRHAPRPPARFKYQLVGSFFTTIKYPRSATATARV